MYQIRSKIITLFIAIIGVVFFKYFSLPLPFLLGPILTCLIAAIIKLPLSTFQPITISMRVILGVAIGATFTSAFFNHFSGMVSSLILIPIFILLIGLIGTFYFHHICKLDPITSYYSAMPGGLQDMVIFGEQAGGNIRAISLIQATRVLIIVTLLPFLLQIFWGINLNIPLGAPIETIPFSQILLMLFSGILGWWLASKIGLTGASILGPLILAAGFSLFGILTYRPPAEAINIAQFFIGVGVGTKYNGISFKELKHDILSAFGYCFFLAALSSIFVALALYLTVFPPLDIILAFSPGGQAEMIILAIAAGADITFVVTHHILRVIIVISFAPIISKFMKKSL